MKVINTETFIKKLNERYPNTYEVLGIYKNYKTPIKIKCKKCNSIYEIRPTHILNGRKCAKCSNRKLKTTEEFKNEVFNLVGNEYTVLGEYKGTNEKILFQHSSCQYKFLMSPNNFLNGKRRCPKCGNCVKKTTEEFKNEVFNLVGNEYTVLGDYKRCHEKIKIKHNKCGNIYEVTPRHFLLGTRCPKCKHSISEDIIERYLINNNIKYENEVMMDGCKKYFTFKI